MTRPARADSVFLTRLLVVSVVIIVGVLAYTRGSSRQLQVEARITELSQLAKSESVALQPLIALCVAEGFREQPRADGELAKLLKRAIEQHGDIEPALRSLFTRVEEANMTLDLLTRNRDRWRRLTE